MDEFLGTAMVQGLESLENKGIARVIIVSNPPLYEYGRFKKYKRILLIRRKIKLRWKKDRAELRIKHNLT